VRQIKLDIRQLLGARKYSVSYRMFTKVLHNVQHILAMLTPARLYHPAQCYSLYDHVHTSEYMHYMSFLDPVLMHCSRLMYW